MDADLVRCPACGDALTTHWQCAICRCFGHANVQAHGDNAICTDCDKALHRRGARRCTTCGDVKALAKFTLLQKRWYRRECKACYAKRPYQRAYQRKWHMRHREQINAQTRAARAKQDPAARSARQHATYMRHRAKRLRYHAEYRARPEYRAKLAATREERNAYQRRYWLRRKLRILRGEA